MKYGLYVCNKCSERGVNVEKVIKENKFEMLVDIMHEPCYYIRPSQFVGSVSEDRFVFKTCVFGGKARVIFVKHIDIDPNIFLKE